MFDVCPESQQQCVTFLGAAIPQDTVIGSAASLNLRAVALHCQVVYMWSLLPTLGQL
jgi:hypothetical protein